MVGALLKEKQKNFPIVSYGEEYGEKRKEGAVQFFRG